MNRNYARGRAYEYKTIRALTADGYYCLRSAGSHSKVDIFAVLTQDGTEKPLFRAIQVKSGNSPFLQDMACLAALRLPLIIRKELWIYKPRQPVRVVII